jgi:hypothetical protein
MGLKTVLVERFGALGGNFSIGLNNKPSGVLHGGLPLEFWRRMQKIGAAGSTYKVNLNGKQTIELCTTSDSEMAKIEFAKMCTEAGMILLFETLVAAPIMGGNTIKGVIIEGKGGRQAILGKIVIDCSADGDIAFQAGAPFQVGDMNGDMQPVSLYFKMNQVDIKKFAEWVEDNPENVTEQSIFTDNLEYGVFVAGFTALLRRFQKEKNIKLVREDITLKSARGKTEIICNCTRAIELSGLKPFEISRAILELYRQIELIVQFLKEYIPGFDESYISEISSMLGVRETRHILGEYLLTGNDVLNAVKFEDSIALDSSAIDIHDTKGSMLRFESYPPYEIPYRSLVPQKIEQLLVAGRCISSDHIAHGRIRNLPPCMATGQAAGFAAGVAVKTGRRVRDIDIKYLQNEITKTGMPIKA